MRKQQQPAQRADNRDGCRSRQFCSTPHVQLTPTKGARSRRRTKGFPLDILGVSMTPRLQAGDWRWLNIYPSVQEYLCSTLGLWVSKMHTGCMEWHWLVRTKRSGPSGTRKFAQLFSYRSLQGGMPPPPPRLTRRMEAI